MIIIIIYNVCNIQSTRHLALNDQFCAGYLVQLLQQVSVVYPPLGMTKGQRSAVLLGTGGVHLTSDPLSASQLGITRSQQYHRLHLLGIGQVFSEVFIEAKAAVQGPPDPKLADLIYSSFKDIVPHLVIYRSRILLFLPTDHSIVYKLVNYNRGPLQVFSRLHCPQILFQFNLIRIYYKSRDTFS